MKSKIKLFASGSNIPLDVRGCIEASAESAKKVSLAKFYVINGTGGCLLSGNSAIDLGLFKVKKVFDVTDQSSQLSSAKQEEKPVTPDVKPKPKPKRL